MLHQQAAMPGQPGHRQSAIVSSTTCFSAVPSADRVIRSLSWPPFTAPLRTRFSISRCDVTPTCFRNLRIAILKWSSSNSEVVAVLLNWEAKYRAGLAKTNDRAARAVWRSPEIGAREIGVGVHHGEQGFS